MTSEQGNFLERTFHLKHNGTTLRTEVLAGITTFVTMAYIIVVNPRILSLRFSACPGARSSYFTIIASIVGTLVMGLFANVPYAQAPGMGLNAFFVYTVCFDFRASAGSTRCPWCSSAASSTF